MIINTMTNRVHIKIDYGKLLERYSVYKIRNKSKNAKEFQVFYSGIKDNIKPIAHTADGKYILVVLSKSGLAKEYANDYEITQLHFTEIQKEKDFILLRLINSLLAKESSYFEVDHDPYGLYYLVDTKASKLIAIKIFIDRDMFLSLNVTTFIKTQSVKDSYKINESKLIKVLKKEDGMQLYKMGNYANKKSSYRFLGLMKNSKKDLIQESKVYALIRYIKEIEQNFSDLIKINFHIFETGLLDTGKDAEARKIILQENIRQGIKELKYIHIANYTDIDLSVEIETFKEDIQHYLGSPLEITHSNRIKKGVYNFTITYEEEYYEKYKLKDPYIYFHKDTEGKTQNITLDTFQNIKGDRKLLQVLLKELIIKKEIKERKLILPYNDSSNKITMIYPYHNKEKEYEFYKIAVNGRSIDFVELSDFERHTCLEIAFNLDRSNILEAVIFQGNNINYILKSKEFPLPKVQEIKELTETHMEPKYLQEKKILEIWDNVYNDKKQELKEQLIVEMEKYRQVSSGKVLINSITLGKNNNRFKVALEKYLGKSLVLSLKGKKKNRHCIESLIGIRYCMKEHKYYVGELNNIPQSINNSSPIREVHTHRGTSLLTTILPMLSEYFVKNGSFTVLPYPLKYVREYYKTRLE